MGRTTETIQVTTTPDFKKQLEQEAARLNLSLSAYLFYLHSRQRAGIDPSLLDRMVEEVFGRYGRVMRRLAD
ncbi:MAG: hypothetical protein HUU22_08750 [Phycisphaerae bacterium]|nr:hypothetical protein [Phycisphaerae bacterium]NUQ46109.1 hypothetical protein [Phycisphaerae bacterium]